MMETPLHQGVDSPSAALSRLAQAWHAGDPDEYAAQFTDDADYVAYDGTRMVGRSAIADGHRDLFAGFMRGSVMTHADVVVNSIAPDVALVCATGGIVMRGRPEGAAPHQRRLSSVTYLLVRSAGRWRIAHFQNTRYRPWDKTLVGRIIAATSRRKAPDVARD
jgi:uncharacterized protein (TIGR02246 family)